MPRYSPDTMTVLCIEKVLPGSIDSITMVNWKCSKLFAFSDHHPLVVQVKVPNQLSRLVCPKSKPLFKSRPEVIEDHVF